VWGRVDRGCAPSAQLVGAFLHGTFTSPAVGGTSGGGRHCGVAVKVRLDLREVDARRDVEGSVPVGDIAHLALPCVLCLAEEVWWDGSMCAVVARVPAAVPVCRVSSAMQAAMRSMREGEDECWRSTAARWAIFQIVALLALRCCALSSCGRCARLEG